MAIAAGDFGGDGRLDLAVANSDSGNVSVLMGNGDGTFQPAVNYLVGYVPTADRGRGLHRRRTSRPGRGVQVNLFASAELLVLLNNGGWDVPAGRRVSHR